MLRKLRILLAIIAFISATLIFVDFSASVHPWIGWIAKIQFLPALLALNLGVLAVLIIATLVLGRVYCSVICPLGILQDIIGRVGRAGRRLPYRFSPALSWLRMSMLAVMVLATAFGISAVVTLLAPYSTFGRIVSSLIGPLWRWGNNGLADIAAQNDSYMFAHTEFAPVVWSMTAAAIAALVIIGILAWRNGRTYCNTICPVGTLLGYLSKFSLFAPVIDTSKCTSCGVCGRKCKASCINTKEHSIDYTRCVACMDCIDNCNQGAISFSLRIKTAAQETTTTTSTTSQSRRSFLGIASLLAAGAAAKAAEKTVDGGLAKIEEKKVPNRRTRIVPPGAIGIKNLESHCTACQLCVQVCPTGVLRPSTSLATFMQPESSYETGYCRPECTRCSDVCPSGAIRPIKVEDKVSTQIGHAVWIKENCVALRDGVHCGNCARHCPVQAITMVPSDSDNPESPWIPVVNDERCIGCGACENLCPARPFSAIYVEGHERHRTV